MGKRALEGFLGYKGERGYSAYEIAVLEGYEGTEEEWINHFGLDLSGYVQTDDVVDDLTHEYTTRPLSAKQGKVLNDSIIRIEHTVVPSGSILAWSTSTAPTGWLICDGSAVSRTTYADLYSVLGTTYGEGDGSTTFNLPNLKGKVIVGADSNDTDFDTLGETGGEKTHTLTIDEMPNHSHKNAVKYTISIDGQGGITYTAGTQTYGTIGGYDVVLNTGGDGAHNNLQPYMVLNYIIKI